MLGIIFTGISSMFSEVSSTLGKKEVTAKKESLYSFGFLNLFFGMVFFLCYGFFRGSFVFSLASLSTFLLRLVLEIFQAHFSFLATVTAERSLFGFVRILTIPLLLIADLFLGYSIQSAQVLGIALIILSICILFASKGVNKKGLPLVLFVALNPVITISLYKYDISHFNSVAAEQGIVTCVLALYFLVMALWRARENPFSLLRKPIFLLQGGANGVAEAFGSFAYLFAPASIITAGSRAFSVLASILAGNLYFKEKRLSLKLLLFLLIVGGILLLVV